MFKIVDDYNLCQKLTSLYTTKTSCFKYDVKECDGACVNEETPESYNKRVHRLIEKHSYTNKNMLIIDKGREVHEKSVILIENGIFKMKASSKLAIDINKYYADDKFKESLSFEETDEIYDTDYTIENAKAKINIRIGQSKFRKEVLENFNNKWDLKRERQKAKVRVLNNLNSKMTTNTFIEKGKLEGSLSSASSQAQSDYERSERGDVRRARVEAEPTEQAVEDYGRRISLHGTSETPTQADRFEQVCRHSQSQVSIVREITVSNPT